MITTPAVDAPPTTRRVARAVHRATSGGLGKYRPAEVRTITAHVSAGDYRAALVVAREILGDDELVGFNEAAGRLVGALESVVEAFADAVDAVLG